MADAQAEVSRQAPSVQAPSTADVTDQPPAALIEQHGGAAVEALGQAAAQAAPEPPVPAPHQPDPLPPPDAGAAAADSDVAALAETAMTQCDAAASAAQQSAANLEGMRSAAGDVAATPVQYAAPGRPQPGAEQRRAVASDMVSGFLTTVGDRAARVTDLGPAAADRYSTAASTAVDQIAAAVEEHTQAIAGRITQLRTQAQAQAESARESVGAQHASATVAISSSTETARQQLETELASALQAIEAGQTTQLQVIEERYRTGDERFRAAGRTVGDEAAQRGEQMAAEYMRGLVDKDDSFLDGPLTYNRGKARADTAREISKAYRSGLVDEANKQADQAQQGKARDIEAVHTTAQKARETLQQQYTATLATLAHAEDTAHQQADDAYTSLTAAISQALAGSQQTLDQHEVSVTENLRAAARAQAAGAEQQARDLTAATHDQIAAAAANLIGIGAAISAQVQQAPPPRADELTASLADATAQLDGGVAATQGQLDQGQALGEQQLSQTAQTIVDGLGASTQTGLDGTTASAADAADSITSIAGSAPGVFDSIQQNHDATLATTTATATGGFNQAVTGVQQAYDEMSRGLEQGFAKSAAGLEQGLRGALGKMEQEIPGKAEENAAAVPPRWKSVVKWLLIIAVIVVVALVIGPFVIGAVGAALGTGAVMTGIIAGAIVGAATGATIQVINNWASNRPLGEGVAKAALIGAIGGAVGGGFGAYFSSAAQAGTTVVNTAFRQFMANTAINVATETVMNVVTTGHFTWEALGWSIVSAVALGGAMHAAGGLEGVQGIQEASMGAGESVGGAIRSGLGGTVSINYRPTTTASGQTDQETGNTGGTQTDEETGSRTGGTGRAWVHPDESEEGFFHPLPDDVPVEHGPGSGLSEGERLTTYADALRSGARRNPATAAARGETGPYIRDNLYTGKALTNVVERLQEQGVLEVAPEGGSVTVADPDRYVQWLERAYRQHGEIPLDPRMREAILGYVGQGEPLEWFGTDPQTGGGSSGGPLPGTHAELLAINDLLVSGDIESPANVATVRARTGSHFAACVHCGGIIDRLPTAVKVIVWTGRAIAAP